MSFLYFLVKSQGCFISHWTSRGIFCHGLLSQFRSLHPLYVYTVHLQLFTFLPSLNSTAIMFWLLSVSWLLPVIPLDRLGECQCIFQLLNWCHSSGMQSLTLLGNWEQLESWLALRFYYQRPCLLSCFFFSCIFMLRYSLIEDPFVFVVFQRNILFTKWWKWLSCILAKSFQASVYFSIE